MDNETSRKRPLEEEEITNGKDSKRSNADKMPSLKLLIPNHMAGKLIGKGGSKVNELESKHGASIQVSPNKEFYPGTDERVVTISAEIEEIIEFCKDMIKNILVDTSERRTYSGNFFCFKIVITNVAVGFVIGKGGAIIKIIQDESCAKINIAKQDKSPVHGERVVTISGTIEEQCAACSQIIEKMSAEPMKMSNTNVKYGGYISGIGGGVGGGSVYTNSMNMGYALTQQSAYQQSAYRNYPVKADIQRYPMDIMNITNSYNGTSCYEQKSSAKTTHMIQMEISNSVVGGILGRQGQIINEITRTSGARINFSPKDEFSPGTNDRILTIKGGKKEIETAFMLVDQRVAQVENELSDRR